MMRSPISSEARLFSMEGSYEQAVDEFDAAISDAAISLDPEYAAAYRNRAAAYM